jgi:hypothetical protein
VVQHEVAGDPREPRAQALVGLALAQLALHHHEHLVHDVVDVGRLDAERPRQAPHEVDVLAVT